MYFAVIGDILSNFVGLDAVLASLQEQGIYRVVQTGNLSADGSGLKEIIALLRRRDVLVVQGKYDRELLRRCRAGNKATPSSQQAPPLSPVENASITFLADLRRKEVFVEEGLRILLCHGSVNSAGMILDSQTPRSVYQRQREQESAQIIISGGAASHFNCTVDQTLFVIPGSLTTANGDLRYTLVDTEVLPIAAKNITMSLP